MRAEMDLSGGRDRAYTCRNCVFVEEEGGGRAVPGPYCRNPLGVFSMDDCPVLLGRECRQFAAREGAPAVTPDGELEDLRQELLRDYLRWTYWERVRNLRRSPEEIPAKKRMEVEEEAPREGDEAFVYHAPVAAPEVAAAPGVAAPGEKPPEEKYPGQRRSEDRRKKRRAAAAAAAAAASAVPTAEGAAAVPGGDASAGPPPEPPGPKTVDEILAETPSAAPLAPRGRGGDRRGSSGPAPAGREGGGRRRRRRRGSRGPGSDAPPRPAPGSGPRRESGRPQGPPSAAPAPSAPSAPSAPPVPGSPPTAPGAREGGGRRRRRRRRRGGPRPGGGGPPGGAAPPPSGPA